MTTDHDLDVHTEHCCVRHGCKYGNDQRCTVASGQKTQSRPCETCLSPMAQLHDAIGDVLAADDAYAAASDSPAAFLAAIVNLRGAIARLRRAKDRL